MSGCAESFQVIHVKPGDAARLSIDICTIHHDDDFRGKTSDRPGKIFRGGSPVQNEYIRIINWNLKPAHKAKVKATRAAKGMRAAIAVAKRLAG